MSGGVLRAVCTATLTTLVVTSPAAAAPVDPGTATGPAAKSPAARAATNKSVAQLLTELQKLYQQAEEATETYNGTATELKKRKAQTKKLHASLVAARTALSDSRDEAGQLAREQYQGQSDISSYMQLLLARDPEHLLDQEHVIRRAAAGRAATVKRLTGAEKRADDLAAESRKVLNRQQALATRQKKQRDAVQSRLKAVETKLATLSGAQLAELSRLEQQGTAKAQGALAASGALSSTRSPSRAGGEAVKYAIGQVGKPYVWGAEGPDSFDCSGLTSQAWAKAGRVIPRTSQEQWRQLPKVPLNALRPGDLVIYFPKATHVALYIGNGQVVQAPRPGSQVKVSPVASNPLLGAVRPDPQNAPLSAFKPPQLPQGASSGSDAGYSSSSAPEQ
ncbi:C40 family peptidase [Streptomyces atratus]|uniref:C40 family peptidase n=1 Tax=Streptomyces atratus TaxID=1893 RepID=UPI002258367A|nr:C40 family peptidase [Streptomyces atratus]MCX5340895.1 NlpC/P60 family protein [Streptomyces atratus]